MFIYQLKTSGGCIQWKHIPRLLRHSTFLTRCRMRFYPMPRNWDQNLSKKGCLFVICCFPVFHHSKIGERGNVWTFRTLPTVFFFENFEMLIQKLKVFQIEHLNISTSLISCQGCQFPMLRGNDVQLFVCRAKCWGDWWAKKNCLPKRCGFLHVFVKIVNKDIWKQTCGVLHVLFVHWDS